MRLAFRGICNGTETKVSGKSGKPYQITKFCEFPSLNTFEVFGDLGIAPTLEPVDWELDGQILSVSNVKVLTGNKKGK